MNRKNQMASRQNVGAQQPPMAPSNNGAKKNRLVSAINYNNGITGQPKMTAGPMKNGNAVLRQSQQTGNTMFNPMVINSGRDHQQHNMNGFQREHNTMSP